MKRYIFILIFFCCFSLPAKCNDSIGMLINDTLALNCKLDLILQSKNCLSFSYYAIGEDEVGLKFIAAACYKARQGVRVQIIIERSKAKMSTNVVKILKENGIKINYYNSFKLLKTVKNFSWLHDKLLVVDSLYVILGGRNLNNKYYPNSQAPTELVDIETLIKGKAGGDAEKYVDHLMSSNYANHSKVRNIDTARYNYLKKEIEKDIVSFKERDVKNYDHLLAPVNSAEYLNDNYKRWPKSKRIAHVILTSLQQSKSSIVCLSPYLIPSIKFTRALKKARKRGVDITLVSNSPQVSDAKIIAAAYMNDRRKYLKRGIKVYEYNGEKMMHDKIFFVDDSIAVVGSYNFDNLSYHMTSECMAKIKDKNYGIKMQKHIQSRIADCWEVKHPRDKNPYNEPKLARKVKWTRFLLRVFPFIRRFL